METDTIIFMQRENLNISWLGLCRWKGNYFFPLSCFSFYLFGNYKCFPCLSKKFFIKQKKKKQN